MNDQQPTASKAPADPPSAERDVLPCPFCGEVNVEVYHESYQYRRIQCVECGASSGNVKCLQLDRHGNVVFDHSDADGRALAEWNRRAAVDRVLHLDERLPEA